MISYSQKLAEIRKILPPETKLLVVSKSRSIQEIKDYYDLGQRDFGENKVQELSEKAHELLPSCPEIKWHMIGHLQSNKINQLFQVPGLTAIHSVHDRPLLNKLIQSSGKLSHPVGIFLQVNTSHEVEKSGFTNPSALMEAASVLKDHEKLKLTGLMTMGTIRTEDFEQEARRCFQDLVKLKAKMEAELGIKLQTSMGMSQDYHLALEARSNWIRLGTMMFVP